MPCIAMPLPGPSVTCLDFLLNWDLSGPTPQVTITNNSTVVDAANLKWWFYVGSPSGLAIYGSNLNGMSVLPTPDVSGVAWTTKTIALPTPFGNQPCGQIEFAPNAPFVVYVFVNDSHSSPAVPFWQLSKNTILVRPNGNSREKTCGNFGAAKISMQVDCLNKNIACFDSTNLMYNNILVPLSTSNVWELTYPQDPSGVVPNRTATNTPNVNFPISVNSKGYVLYLREYATYDYGNGITVTIQYKAFDSDGSSLGLQFAINCNTNLCLIQCQMKKFYELSKGCCGTLEDAELMNKMTRMNFLFSQVLTGIFQPLCGIDVPGIIEEIKKIGKFDNSCDCNCGDDNFGFSNPTGGGASGGCCPVYSNVIDINTGIAPYTCPNGYFPAYIYDPTGYTVIGVALSMADEINILNANSAWRAYGTAFAAGNCVVGWYPANGGTIIPNIIIDIITGGNGQGSIVVPVLSKCTNPPAAPASCPAGYFPAQVYNPTATTIIGIASDVNSMVGIINANSAWEAFGTAYVVDNCHVGFYPLPGVGTIPNVYVLDSSCINTGCINGSQIYPVTINDICYPAGTPITAASFPLNIYVDFGLGAGLEFVGNVANQTEMLAALNAMADKPVSVTFSAGATVDQVIITNTDCNTYSGVITLTADAASNSYLLYSGNHFSITGSVPQDSPVSEYAFSIQDLSILGAFPGIIKGTLWHTIKLGNILVISNSNRPGSVIFYDVTNPLMPVYLRTIYLNAVIPRCFTGNPHSETIATSASPSTAIATIYDLYFPTDFYTPMNIRQIYVVESNTGCIWTVDFYDTVGVTASFQDDRLIGKCPRIFINNKIYFTQDGDLETATGQTSGVAIGNIVILDVTDFSSGGLSSTTILLNDVEYVWAASYDGSDTIYFTGNKTSVAKYSISTDTVTDRYNYFLGFGISFGYRLNTTYFNGYLYMVPQQMPVYIGMIIQVTAFGGSGTINHFQVPPGGAVLGAFNFTPLGNCLGILTSAKVPGVATAQVNIYKVDGTYLATIPLNTDEEFYNVLPIPNVYVTTPNTFIP